MELNLDSLMTATEQQIYIWKMSNCVKISDSIKSDRKNSKFDNERLPIRIRASVIGNLAFFISPLRYV